MKVYIILHVGVFVYCNGKRSIAIIYEMNTSVYFVTITGTMYVFALSNITFENDNRL